MCVLTRDEIERELQCGRLRIEPLEADQIGPASIDLHLDSAMRALQSKGGEPVHVLEETEPELENHLLEVDDHYVLEPGQTVLGLTRERIFLPPDLCGWLEGRSRFARLGLTIHVSSGFVQPGVANHQVLELSNVSGAPLALHPGTRICQIVLERTHGQAIYRGRFATQDSP